MRFPARLVTAALVTAAAFSPAGAADAHPLGNLTVNTSLDVIVRPERLDATYVLDLAELPTVQARQQFDTTGGANGWATQRCVRLAAGVTVSGTAIFAMTGPPTISFPPGQGGLDTLRLECPLGAAHPLNGATTHLDLADSNDTDRIGWREIVVRGDSVTLTASDVPSVSPSAHLTVYPPTGGAPPRTLAAHIVAHPGGPTLTGGPPAVSTTLRAQTRGADALTQRMNRLVSNHRLTAPLGALAMALAIALGAIHALAPGHGKTLMAATVVARRGSAARQVLTIGTTVALTHTAGVLVLGTLIWTSQAIAPDRVLPWLTLASGALLVATGTALLLRRRHRGPRHHHHGPTGHNHHAQHDHADHAHAPRVHEHDHHLPHEHPDPHQHDDPNPLSRRWLVTMGVAGGMVPTPSALVVLLGATALGRTWFGVVLVAIYGIGMATTLMAAGVALVRLQGWLEAHWYQTRWLTTTLRIAPLLTATALIGGGLLLAARSLSSV